ncbi:MAG: NAD-dependent epimerase/dehydratase family protein [Deltaproteobacteria bacterium]|nr:MAG: NAD-dependent epimerase/dehydratase family protein [Deltaproteobacteria bacterium]
MKVLVTGVAGFIGSHLAEFLVARGDEVVGIDAFSDYYPRSLKEANIASLREEENFHLIEGDLVTLPLSELLTGVEIVFHQAAQAGVRASWGESFGVYTDTNVLATQRLLEACRGRDLHRFVYASSSSVYGDTADLPMKEETTRPRPVSPYGVTKLAGEHLCYLYWKNFRIPTVSLRYFTVYGPRQRPDMAFHKLMKAVRRGETFPLYGDGEQTRDFTYVSDVVRANLLAATAQGVAGAVFNIGGGGRITMNELICLVSEVSGESVNFQRSDPQKGDVRHTSADLSLAGEKLGFSPEVSLREGLARQWTWICEVYGKR